MTPAEELRAAAEKLRKLAAEATTAPWIWQRWHSDTCPADCDDPTCFLLIVGSPHGPVGDADVDRDVFAVERSVHERGESDAAYIATMGPNVGAALAKLLDDCAELHEEKLPGHRGQVPPGCQWCADEDFPCSDMRNALAVAREILGRQP